MICIENIFADLTDRLNAELAASSIKVHFRFGTIREIMDYLNALTPADADKYPLIALIEPFLLQKETSQMTGHLKLRFLIATFIPSENPKAESLEGSFKPILFPIYETFIRQIECSAYFRTDRIKHIFLNHFGISKDTLEGYDSSVFNNHIHAIELKEVELDIKNKSCHIKNF